MSGEAYTVFDYGKVELVLVGDGLADVACRRCGHHAPGGFGRFVHEAIALAQELADVGIHGDDACTEELLQKPADAWRELAEADLIDRDSAA